MVERMTLRKEDGSVDILAMQSGMESVRDWLIQSELKAFNAVIERLATYEDTGMQPDEIEMAKTVLIGREIARITEINDIPISRLIELAKAEKDDGPLSLAQLQTMAGQPVWCAETNCWGIIKLESIGPWAWQPFLIGATHYEGGAVDFELDITNRGYTLYRHKPEEKLQSGGDASGSDDGVHG